MRRPNPEYDGSAGPREQTMYFLIDYSPEGEALRSVIHATIGEGTGTSDSEFRVAQMRFHADVSRMAPFDTYQIDQQYGYEQGVLREEVTLLKGTTAWVRNHEVATLFAPKQFESAPTRFK